MPRGFTFCFTEQSALAAVAHAWWALDISWGFVHCMATFPESSSLQGSAEKPTRRGWCTDESLLSELACVLNCTLYSWNMLGLLDPLFPVTLTLALGELS